MKIKVWIKRRKDKHIELRAMYSHAYCNVLNNKKLICYLFLFKIYTEIAWIW